MPTDDPGFDYQSQIDEMREEGAVVLADGGARYGVCFWDSGILDGVSIYAFAAMGPWIRLGIHAMIRMAMTHDGIPGVEFIESSLFDLSFEGSIVKIRPVRWDEVLNDDDTVIAESTVVLDVPPKIYKIAQSDSVSGIYVLRYAD